MKNTLVFLLAIVAGVYSVNTSTTSGKNGSVSTAGMPDDASSRRSIGGTPADPREHPYLAALVIDAVSTTNTNTRSYCSAVLVRPNRLLTAAHCCVNYEWRNVQFTAALGSRHVYSGGTRIVASNVIPHPQFTVVPTLYNDIAVVILPVNADPRFTPIALPSPSMLRESFAGLPATLVGYGATHNGPQEPNDPYITRVTVPIITNDECRAALGGNSGDSHLCIEGVYGVGSCFGDSGGPLFVNINGVKTLVGISSFIVTSNCGMGLPAVFTRVTSFHNWFMPLLS